MSSNILTLAENYYVFQGNRVDPATINTYRYRVALWAKYQTSRVPRSSKPFDAFRNSCLADGKRVRTIESTIQTIGQIVRHAGREVSTGTPLLAPAPDPDVPRIEHLDALYRVAHTARWPNRLSATKRTDWWRAFIVLAGWTGFRLSDLRLLADQHVAGSSIELRAEKTKRFGRPRLVVPVTPVVRRHLGMLGRGNPTLFGLTAQGKQLRRTLSELADQAGVPYVTPKGFRLYAINAWSRADGLAGELIQGRKLGSMDNYLDVESHLHHHARKVKIPNSWLTDQERDRLAQRRDNLLHMFDRAKPGKQKLILKLCREIA